MSRPRSILSGPTIVLFQFFSMKRQTTSDEFRETSQKEYIAAEDIKKCVKRVG